jgi:hypothetical protein
MHLIGILGQVKKINPFSTTINNYDGPERTYKIYRDEKPY